MHWTIIAMWCGVAVNLLFPGMTAAAACTAWVARVVSIQGNVQARSAGDVQWQPARLDATYCHGDTVQVQGHSRLALLLPNEAILRLDQNTTITFTGLESERTSVLDLIRGVVYFFSRRPRGLKIMTPYVNAAVEGTEFLVEVRRQQTVVTVFEGRLAATNQLGSLLVAAGQTALTQEEQAPVFHVLLHPRDAVQWALYYPPILELHPGDFPAETTWSTGLRKSLKSYQDGDLSAAFANLPDLPAALRDPRVLTYRAALLLSVGRVDEARADIDRALQLEAQDGRALALRAVIAVAQNDKTAALSLARTAVELAPEAATAHLALSYAQQAHFDLYAARESLQRAVQLAPGNALAQARLAELWLSVGELSRALRVAQAAVTLQPTLARPHTVLGFAWLTQLKVQEAQGAFLQAIGLDQADPLPRLGLGLAQIRHGKLQAGRENITIALSLDPNNALVRSYLGKAYFEEKRQALATEQFAMAKSLDPLDPTPWFYQAIQQQTVNRPVEALHDLQRSVELNDNRAVYRSRLLLDEDLAARGATLGRLYNELSFQQRALVEGWAALHTDPGNAAAHRLLADSYAVLPRHDIARVSELLQSQLLQPLNITPVQPQLAESGLFILSGAGPAEPSLNEFNPLFNRNRFTVLASGVAGTNNLLGDELVLAGVAGRLSFSAGQFFYKTAGFRPNNDLEQNIFNLFTQVSLSHTTSLQAEFRYTDSHKGDLPLRFEANNFSTTLRQADRNSSVRLGLHHALTPHADILTSVIYSAADFDTFPAPGSAFRTDLDGILAEVQYLYHAERFHLISGAGHFDAELRDDVSLPFLPAPSITTSHVRHTNGYLYTLWHYPRQVTWTVGGSADFFDAIVKREQFNPKIGLSWTPFSGTTLRAAFLRVLKRTLLSDQTLEPTQVAGFNQFFDDPEGTVSWRYGFGLDQKFSASLFGGVEFSWRELEVPFGSPLSLAIEQADWKETLGRAYLYWTPHPWLALRLTYQYERFTRGPAPAFGEESIAQVDTHRVPIGLSVFHPTGLRAQLQATYIRQHGAFANAMGLIVPGADQFWVSDATLGYRLPRRRGLLSLEARNLFNQRFHFQDTDPAHPVVYPERLILARFTLGF